MTIQQQLTQNANDTNCNFKMKCRPLKNKRNSLCVAKISEISLRFYYAEFLLKTMTKYSLLHCRQTYSLVMFKSGSNI